MQGRLVRYSPCSIVRVTQKGKGMNTKYTDDPIQILSDLGTIAQRIRTAIKRQLPLWERARNQWLDYFKNASHYYSGPGGERLDLEQGRFPIGRYYVGRPPRLIINCETGSLETHPYQLAANAEVISAYVFEPEWFDIRLVLSWLDSMQAKASYGKGVK